MKKVAYMFGGLNRGGTETLMLDVFRNYRNAPFPFIGVHRKNGEYHDAFYSAGPSLYQLDPKRLGYIRYIYRLRRLLQSEKITIIHTQHWLDCIYAYLATIGMKIQLVNTFHGFYSMKGLLGILCRLSILMADDVCFVSRYEQEWYMQKCSLSENKCHVIYNGVDFAKLKYSEPSSDFVVSTKKARLVMVGNFGRVRDHITIFQALRYLKEMGIGNFDVYFIGKRIDAHPQIYNECERIQKENNLINVHFLGGRGDVPSILKVMDGFVYSSANDTFGIAVVEAMAAGLPVVVNDWPIMKEVCGEESNAIRYYHSKNVEECAQEIQYLLNHLPECQIAAQEHAKWVQDAYSLNSYFKRLSKIYLDYDNN